MDLSIIKKAARSFFYPLVWLVQSDSHEDRIETLEATVASLDYEVFELPNLQIKRLTDSAIIPTRGSDGAIGLDLYSSGPAQVIGPHERKLISTGIAMAIPFNYYGRVAPRSGLALKSGINVLGGVVDEDYRGEVFVMLHNTDNFKSFTVEPNARIAQLILEKADQLRVVEVHELPGTDRGDGAFGSTGDR